jgi:putative addiction module killer protein
VGYTWIMDVRATSDFLSWIDDLKDRRGRARILVRIDRLAHGNAGDSRILKGGIAELRIDTGPGYRIYYVQSGSVLTLLAGGDKFSQAQDMARATRLAKESRV